MSTGVEQRVTLSQAGRQLNLSVSRVRQLVDGGLLRGEKTPLGRLVDAADVERLMREREERQRAEAA